MLHTLSYVWDALIGLNGELHALWIHQSLGFATDGENKALTS